MKVSGEPAHKAVVAGFGMNLLPILKRAGKAGAECPWPDWDISFVASSSPKSVAINANALNRILAVAEPAAAQVLAFRPDKETQSRVEAALRPYFRFTWLDNRWLNSVGKGAAVLIERLADRLAVEGQWVEKIKPADEKDELILPECGFAVSRQFEHVWRDAHTVEDLSRIDSVANKLMMFKENHYRRVQNDRRSWVDDDDRCFKFSERRQRHGLIRDRPPFKYSFPFGGNFHYDVGHLRGRPFSVRAYDGALHRRNANEHVNMDPHGVVR